MNLNFLSIYSSRINMLQLSAKSVHTNPVRAKMSPSWISVFIFLVCASSVPSVVAQFNSYSNYDCDKYCFASCNEYFPGSQFSECVRANVHCSCHSKFSSKNPLFMFLMLVVLLLIFCFSCGMCHRYCRNNNDRRNPHRVVAEPVEANTRSCISIVSRADQNASNNSRRSSSANNGNNNNNSPRRASGGFVNPLAPQKSNDVPPEYMPPPPYNECVIDINSLNTTEKKLDI